ncbi:MAG: hypothetical protein IPN32_39130 [Deltaproteobacteria bacterium]|nr:hypothetical protein [Deltaproteobacteria bacterium]
MATACIRTMRAALTCSKGTTTMQILPDVPAHQFDPSQPLLTTFVVLGPGHADSRAGFHAGRIKAVRFGPNVASPLLLVEPITRGGRMTGVQGVSLTAKEVAKGTMFLRDMYAAEGRLADYDRYVARERAIHSGMRVEPLAEDDPRLPAKLREWVRARGVKDTFVWDADDPAPSAPEAAEKPVRRRAASDSPAGGA